MTSQIHKTGPCTDWPARSGCAESYGNRATRKIFAGGVAHVARHWVRAGARLLLAASFVCPGFAAAEDDGNELLGLMDHPASREAASAFIEDVRLRWDGTLFCIAQGTAHVPDDAAAAAFAAVRTYLQEHPEERARPRRYLIVQGLRAAFHCPAR